MSQQGTSTTALRLHPDVPLLELNDREGWRIQPVDATIWLNRSAGVSKFSVFRGRSFNRLATASSPACE
jgi:hypothetical protein